MHKILTATLAASVMAVGVAQSATTSTTFAVTATVLSACSATATNLAFPNYTPGGGAVTANSAITVRCSKGTGYTVSLNVGTTTGGLYTQRLMAAAVGATTLQYNLFTTVGLATVFGDGTGTTGTVAGTGAGVALASATTVPVYGQVLDSATNQAAVPGAYADTITATVTY